MKLDLINADCWEHIKTLKDNSIHHIITNPPYDIGFMNKGWDKNSIVSNPEFWKECLRVLKPGGHLLAFSHSRTSHRQTSAIEQAGFEIRDTIMWLYGSGFPKSHNISKKLDDWKGWGTALKPAHEPVVMARKPFEGTVADNVLEHGTGAINIDASRIELQPGENISITREDNKNIDTQEQGWGFKSISRGNEGRWPANVILDEEAGKILDEHMPAASRFFYCPKVSSKERNAGCEELEDKVRNRVNSGGLENDPKFAPVIQKNNHPTVKPIKLMEYLIKLVSKEGQTILDPFLGSGSTGIACKNLNRDFVGIERDENYFNIAQTRIGENNDAND